MYNIIINKINGCVFIANKSKRTTPGIPTWSPTVVLTWPATA